MQSRALINCFGLLSRARYRYLLQPVKTYGIPMPDALELLKTRRSVKPREMTGPGPSPAALGYGACWLTGWFAFDRDVMDGLGLKADEKFAGFIHIGTVVKPNEDRPRPTLSDIVTRF